MIVHSISLKGKRPQNEDRMDIVKKNNINFFGVYDGHGGNKVSTFLKDNISGYFLKKDIQYPLKDTYINKVFDHLQKKLEIEHKNYSHTTGSTCLIAINYKHNGNNYFHIANTGDCRAIICNGHFAKHLTLDHKPSWPQETERITKLGGKIYKDSMGEYRIVDLSVSRAFGDFDSRPYVTHSPEIFKHKVQKDDQFMIMACDGLWDVMTNQEAANFVLQHMVIDKKKRKVIPIKGQKNIAKALGDHAIKIGSMDNLSIIIIFFV